MAETTMNKLVSDEFWEKLRPLNGLREREIERRVPLGYFPAEIARLEVDSVRCKMLRRRGPSPDDLHIAWRADIPA